MPNLNDSFGCISTTSLTKFSLLIYLPFANRQKGRWIKKIDETQTNGLIYPPDAHFCPDISI